MTTKTNNNGTKNLLCDGMSNQKLVKTIKINRAHIVTFSLPAVVTCHGADKCLKSGYCHAGNYNFKSNKDKFAMNYQASQRADFVDRINAELSDKWTFTQYVRIHPTGDFYDMTYFKKWVAIANDNPSITFYAYTKSIDIVKAYKLVDELPANMVITYSYGSKFDNLINPSVDYHAIVISPNESVPAGYVDGSTDDVLMCKGHKKIALRYHHPYIKWEDSGFSEIINPL